MPLSPDEEAQLAELTGELATNADARRVLGKATELLAQGYARLGDVPSSVFENYDARGAARDLLDGANSWAGKVYGTIPDDTAAVDPDTRVKVQSALKQSWQSLQAVEQVANETYWDFPAALRTVLGAAGAAAAAVVKATWPVWLLAAAVGVAYLTLRSTV